MRKTMPENCGFLCEPVFHYVTGWFIVAAMALAVVVMAVAIVLDKKRR